MNAPLQSLVNTGPLQLRSKKAVLSYRNDDVLHKFKTQWDISDEATFDVFEQTKKFLFLAAYAKTQCFTAEVQEQILIIDEMWHTFILFTDAYHSFCEQNFDGYLHHEPLTKAGRKETIKDVSSQNVTFARYKRNTLARQVELIDELYGFDTVYRWYCTYPDIYSIEKMNVLRKPIAMQSKHNVSPEGIMGKDFPKNKLQLVEKIMAGAFDSNSSCGCSGKGCGAGCSCNSRVS
ncbi:MAG: hypothetical protein WD491_11865 [Balneolales bacterium]